MNFLADESVDRQIVDRLRQQGYRVWYVAEMEPGISDDAVCDLANREEALLLTADKDFGEWVHRRPVPGVVFIRLAGLSPNSKARVVASTIDKHTTELPQPFAISIPGAIRIRRQRQRE